jgi:hypothetical protein
MIHESSDDRTLCTRPYNCRDTDVLPGLMTLKNFAGGGYDVDACKVLVCVKSMGARKTCELSTPFPHYDQHLYQYQHHMEKAQSSF